MQMQRISPIFYFLLPKVNISSTTQYVHLLRSWGHMVNKNNIILQQRVPNEDGVLSHGEGLDGLRGPGDILLRGGRLYWAGHAVTAVRER